MSPAIWLRMVFEFASGVHHLVVVDENHIAWLELDIESNFFIERETIDFVHDPSLRFGQPGAGLEPLCGLRVARVVAQRELSSAYTRSGPAVEGKPVGMFFLAAIVIEGLVERVDQFGRVFEQPVVDRKKGGERTHTTRLRFSITEQAQ